jgi:hypothetical protein
MRNNALRAARKRRFCRSDQLCNDPLHNWIFELHSRFETSQTDETKHETQGNGSLSGDES